MASKSLKKSLILQQFERNKKKIMKKIKKLKSNQKSRQNYFGNFLNMVFVGSNQFKVMYIMTLFFYGFAAYFFFQAGKMA